VPASSPRRIDRDVELERFRSLRSTGDRAERNALVEDFAWVARHCARRFADRGEPLDDLHQVALLGVLKAVDRFDPDAGSSFVSFAIPTVLGELRRHFRDTTWAIKVPRRLKDRHVEVGATVEFLSNETGRPPTPDEVAKHLGIPVEDVLEALDAGAGYRAAPLNTSGERGDDDERLGVLLGIDDHGLAGAEDRVLLTAALAALPERERRILQLRFAAGLSQSEIAEQIGVSQVHISRLLRRSIRALQAAMGREGDGELLGSDGDDD
jgi:RNA polymerase sigma-B factor